MEKHFILTEESKINDFGVKLFRIQYTQKVRIANVGGLGGWVEKESNILGNGCVHDNAEVFGNAVVRDNADIFNNARIYGSAEIRDDVNVYNNCEIYGDAKLYDTVTIHNNAKINSAKIHNNVSIHDNAEIRNISLIGIVEITNDAEIFTGSDYCYFQSFGSNDRSTTVFREKNNKLRILCGCFSGTLEEFEKRVELTHGDSKFGKEYKAMIELIKIRFDLL